MARELYQPHDNLFRKVFSNAPEAAWLACASNLLPEWIELFCAVLITRSAEQGVRRGVGAAYQAGRDMKRQRSCCSSRRGPVAATRVRQEGARKATWHDRELLAGWNRVVGHRGRVSTRKPSRHADALS